MKFEEKKPMHEEEKHEEHTEKTQKETAPKEEGKTGKQWTEEEPSKCKKGICS